MGTVFEAPHQDVTGYNVNPPLSVRDRRSALEHVSAEVLRSGMRMDQFMSLAAEGLLRDEHLRELWQSNRDLLVPDWAS